MKFRCGLTKETKEQRERDHLRAKWAWQEQWHDWYAWFPVKVADNDCRWLETVRRRRLFKRNSDGSIDFDLAKLEESLECLKWTYAAKST